MSLAPRHESSSHLGIVRQIRAAASLLVFTKALAVSLFALVTGDNAGYRALVLGISGITFTAASLRSIFESTHNRQLIRKQMGLIVLLLATFGFEFASGLALIDNPHRKTALDILENVLAASLLIGVARAWELAGGATPDCFHRSPPSVVATARRANRVIPPQQHRTTRSVVENLRREGGAREFACDVHFTS